MKGPILLDHGSRSLRPTVKDTQPRRKRRRTTKRQQPNLNAADFYVSNLPGLPSDSTLKLYAGHVPSTPSSDPESDSQLFFMLAKNRDRERLVIWFNGGPGCSSFDSVMMEAGPFRLQKDSDTGQMTLNEIDGAWNEYANVLFVDQPAGTGYSFVSTNHYVHDLEIAADHIVEFLRQFYQIFPEYSEMDTYLAGESYAGQYIPYFADAITRTKEVSTPLKGLLIGNGWIDPWNQYPAYLDFALENDVLTPNSPSYQRLKDTNERCKENMSAKGKEKMGVHENTCEGILSQILESTVQGQRAEIVYKHLRHTFDGSASGMWYELAARSADARDDVKSAFHASRKEGGWVECSGQVGGNFQSPNSKPSVTLLPDLLEKMPILLFAGDQDLICNWLGIQRTAEDLVWNGEQGFGSAEPLDWVIDGRLAGSWQSARNLTVVKIANASHMVPFDVPVTTHDMLLRFMDTDFIEAAGSAAKVPSKIGEEQEAVIGETHPNGTALEAAVDPPPDSGQASLEKQDTSNAGGSPLGDAAAAYYNAGSAAVLILLLFAVGGIFFCLRARTRKYMPAEPELGLGPTPPATPSKGRRSHQHRRGLSSISSKLSHSQTPYDGDNQDPHEMDELVKHRDFDDDEEGHERRQHRQSTELFTVGEEGSEDGDSSNEGEDILRTAARDAPKNGG